MSDPLRELVESGMTYAEAEAALVGRSPSWDCDERGHLPLMDGTCQACGADTSGRVSSPCACPHCHNIPAPGQALCVVCRTSCSPDLAGRTLPRPDHDFIPGHPSPDLCNLTDCQRPKVQHARDTGTGWPKTAPASTPSTSARKP